ncbi:hypothetical protein I7I50_02323 [Histoplasma capsulatum G186AR]|uniref:Uncharacterized protein n=1 Tax=Ajellomyces capsulatus TaxID=5037 RepID=A0A8H7Z7B3_AJECA|nr:hypothetical protein I7I52_01013 [Histoplasma capsulatum]QSS71481.1 hypothetical protein I7I50_02323 [Histoplasma capsulatum G186AR]
MFFSPMPCKLRTSTLANAAKVKNQEKSMVFIFFIVFFFGLKYPELNGLVHLQMLTICRPKQRSL